MTIKNNYINHNNKISMSIDVDMVANRIYTVINYMKNGNYTIYKYNSFAIACKKYKKLEKQLPATW